MRRLHLRNWSVRAKLAALMVAASMLPLGISAYIDIRETRASLVSAMESLLGARSEQIVRELDSIHLGYVRSTERLTRLPVTSEFCKASAAQQGALAERVLGVLKTFPASDSDIRGAGLIDATGRIAVATEPALVGADVSKRTTVRAVLSGTPVISGMYLSYTVIGEVPTVGYYLPVRGAHGDVLCAIGLWVQARAFSRPLKATNGLAGPGSFAVLLDAQGIRIAHTSDESLVMHPAGSLDKGVLDTLVADGRFGKRTRELLEDVRPFPELFERSRAARPDPAMFHGISPVNHAENFGVARRFSNVPWTVAYLSPQQNLTDQLAQATREKALLALGIMVAALSVGIAFAANILRPVRNLADATASLAAGSAHARVPVRGNDELARLARSFNTMADRLQEQSGALQRSHDGLEQRIRERTGLLQAIVDNAPAVIYVKDLQGRFMLVNSQFSTMFHRDVQDVIGKTSYDIFDRASADAFHAMDLRAAQSAEPVEEEESVPQDDGVHTYLSVKCPLRNDSGEVYGIVGVSTDITGRKQDQARQLAQLERLNLLDQISIGIGEKMDLKSIYAVAIRSLESRMPLDLCCICDYDPATGVLTVNSSGPMGPPLAAAAGMGAHRTIPVDGNGLSRCVRGELVYEPDLADSAFPFPRRLAAAGFRCAVLAPLAAENRVFGILIATRRGKDAFSSADCEFLRQLSRHVALAAQQAQLTEDLRRAYEDLRQSQQAVLQQERLSALGQMASGIAHDINNAISPAAIYAETLLEREPGLSPRARNYLEIIARAIDDVAATVARMREFYRPREAQSTMLPMDINALVRQVVELTHARWSDMPDRNGASIELVLDLAAGLPSIPGVESEIREALINLVFNAVDAMPAGGKLTLRTRLDATGSSVEVEVCDTGVGMDGETRRRCLEPFFTTKGERGTGLGLAMVYGMAQRNGAAIEIESEPGRGTTMRLRLPVPAVPLHASALAPPASAGPRMRILAADDDPVLLRSLRDALEADGHAVTTVDTGQAAIDAFTAALAGAEPFDAVLTDLGMPHVDGRQVAAAVKAAAPSTRVILLTGWGNRLAGDGDIPHGADVVLGKPPKLRELRQALHGTVHPPEEGGDV